MLVFKNLCVEPSFSTAVSTVVLMQSVLCKPYIFTKQPKIARQCTPPPPGRDLWLIGCMVEDDFFL